MFAKFSMRTVSKSHIFAHLSIFITSYLGHKRSYNSGWNGHKGFIVCVLEYPNSKWIIQEIGIVWHTFAKPLQMESLLSVCIELSVMHCGHVEFIRTHTGSMRELLRKNRLIFQYVPSTEDSTIKLIYLPCTDDSTIKLVLFICYLLEIAL